MTMTRDEVVAGLRELLQRLDADTVTAEELELVEQLCDFHAGWKAGRQAGGSPVSVPAADDEPDWCWFDDGHSIGIYTLLEDGTCGPQIAKVLTENLDAERRQQAVEEAKLLSTAPALRRFYEVYVEDLQSRPRLPASAICSLIDLQAMCSPTEGRCPRRTLRRRPTDADDPIDEAKADMLR